MRRRTLLAGLGAALAGCTGGEANTTSSPTGTPIDTPARTPNPGSVPPSRTVPGAAVADDGTAVTARRRFSLSEVRYLTIDSGPTTIEPRRDLFVGYDFVVENRGDDRLPAMPDTAFRLRLAGSTFEHVHALRGTVAFADVDQPDDEPEIRPLSWYEGLAPGESVDLQLVFDAVAAPDYRHYLEWDHSTPVDGADAPVYLYPRS